MAMFIKNPQNNYLFGLLVLFVTMYGPRLSPKLPEPILNLFSHPFFRGTVMFLAIYMAQHDFKVALLVTVSFMIVMNIVQNTNLFETFLQNYEKNMEGFISNQDSVAPPVSSCSTYDPKSLNFIGTAVYPLNPNNHLLKQRGKLPARQPAYEGETNWKKTNNQEGFVGSNNSRLDGTAPPVSSCSAYDPSSLRFVGTATYPLNPTNHLLEENGKLPAGQPAYEGETNWAKSV